MTKSELLQYRNEAYQPKQLQLHDIPSGAYFMQIIGNTVRFSSKLIIMN